jgi:hypothetical protein
MVSHCCLGLREKKRNDQQQAQIGGNKRTKSSHDASSETSTREPPTEEADGTVSPLARTTGTDSERELHQDDTQAAAGIFVRTQRVQAQDGSPMAGAAENADRVVTPESTKTGTDNDVDPFQDAEENAGVRTGGDGGENHPPATTTLHALIEQQKIMEAMKWLNDPIGIQEARIQNIQHNLPIHSLILIAGIGSEEHEKPCFDLMSMLIDVHQESLDHPNKKGMIPVQYAEQLSVEKKFIDLLLEKAPHTKQFLAKKNTALVATTSRDIDLCHHINTDDKHCNCNAFFFEKKARHLTKVDAKSMLKELNYAVRTTLKQNMFVEERLNSLVDKSKKNSVTRSFFTDFFDEYHELRRNTDIDRILALCEHEGDCAKCNFNHPIFTSKAVWNQDVLDVNVIKLNREIRKCKDFSEHLITPKKIEENIKEALVTSFFASTQVTSLDHQKEVDNRRRAEGIIEDQKKEISTLNDEKIDLTSRNKKIKETNVDQEKRISTLKKQFQVEKENSSLSVQAEREKVEELREEYTETMTKLVDANIMTSISIDPEACSPWFLELYADRALESLTQDGVSVEDRRSRVELLKKIVSEIIERKDRDLLMFVAKKMRGHLRECKVESDHDWACSFIDMNGLKFETIPDDFLKFLKELTTHLLKKIKRFHTDIVTSAEVKHEVLGPKTRSRSNDSQNEHPKLIF